MVIICTSSTKYLIHGYKKYLIHDVLFSDPFFTQPAPGMLQIEMASLYLTGEYKCVVSDGLSSLERVFHLEVYSGGEHQRVGCTVP